MGLKKIATIGLLGVISLVLVSVNSEAKYEGEISFTAEEIQTHRAGLPIIMRESAECLQADLRFHLEFYKKWGISPFYGDRSTFAKNPDQRRNYLRRYSDDDGWFSEPLYTEAEITYLLKVLKPTSCIGLVLKCMGKGFESAGQANLWERLRAHTSRNGVSGGALQEGLQKLGWTLAYWNPDTSQNETWDEEEYDRKPENQDRFWGYHAYNWSQVVRNRKYLYNRVDDISTLVNFGETVPSAIRNVPFFVGTAHGGYHVFPGSFGQIVEGHSTRQLHDKRTIETSPFNPLVEGGGPRGLYRSGLMAIPPGYGR